MSTRREEMAKIRRLAAQADADDPSRVERRKAARAARAAYTGHRLSDWYGVAGEDVRADGTVVLTLRNWDPRVTFRKRAIWNPAGGTITVEAC